MLLKRQVQVDEIDALVGHVAAKHVQVVAVVEGIHVGGILAGARVRVKRRGAGR